MKGHILIAGGSGFIGTAISREAQSRGYTVTILSRSPGTGRILWNPSKGLIDLKEEATFDAVINLAGSDIAGGRWTKGRKNEILRSRLDSCQTLEAYLRTGKIQTAVYIGASAIGIYGDRGAVKVEDETPITATPDWIISTVQQWEGAHAGIGSLGIRTAIIRIGLVLSKKGGMLTRILPIASLGILPYFGDGRQYWPWIHLEDLVQIMLEVVEKKERQGIYLAVAPQPVTCKNLIQVLNKQFSLPRLIVPVPVKLLSLLLGKMHRMLVSGCNGFPKRLMLEGFRFRFEQVEDAMKNLMGKG